MTKKQQKRMRKPAPVAVISEAGGKVSRSGQIRDYILQFQDKKFTQNHVSHLAKLYDSYDHREFVAEFLHAFQIAVCQDAKNKNADNIIAFFLAILISFEGDVTHILWKEFFNWILNNKNTQPHVRIRMCQFIDKFLSALNIDAVLDENICEGIERYLILNADDFSKQVRSVALNGLQRLQDPSDPKAAIWEHYFFHLNDPDPNVRKTVITSICKNRFSTPKLLDHLLDKVPSVRCHLVQSLANVSYKHFKKEDRIRLLEDGLQNQPEAVANGIMDTIVRSWFTEVDKHYVKLTKNLLIDTEKDAWHNFRRSVSMIKLALKYLFRDDEGAHLQYLHACLTNTGSGHDDLMDSICQSVQQSLVLNGGYPDDVNGQKKEQIFLNCISIGRLTVEFGIFWSAVLEFYQENNEDDDIFPELESYLQYMLAFIRYTNSSTLNSTNGQQKKHHQFMFSCLVDVLSLYNVTDEICRNTMKQVLKSLIIEHPKMKKGTLKQLLQIHGRLYADDDLNLYQDSLCQIIRERLALNRNEDNVKHYLKVVYMLLTERKVGQLTATVKQLYESFVFPRIEDADRKVRIWATRCISTYASTDVTVAQSFYFKLITQLQVQHNVPVWVVVIEAIFDLLAQYGIDVLGATSTRPPHGDHQDEKMARNRSTSNAAEGSHSAPTESRGRTLYNTTSECWANLSMDDSVEQLNILGVLQSLYDDCPDVVIVKPIVIGFCRLVLTQQCQSVELMTKLMVTFFTTNAKYPELVQILSVFFVELCANGQQELLVMALLPTMENVSVDPKVDLDAVIQFVVDSTRPNAIGSEPDHHIRLAHLFLDTIQNNEKHRNLVKILVKYLNQLEIPDDNRISGEILDKLMASEAKCELIRASEPVENFRRKLSCRLTTNTIASDAATELRADAEHEAETITTMSIITTTANSSGDKLTLVTDGSSASDVTGDRGDSDHGNTVSKADVTVIENDTVNEATIVAEPSSSNINVIDEDAKMADDVQHKETIERTMVATTMVEATQIEESETDCSMASSTKENHPIMTARRTTTAIPKLVDAIAASPRSKRTLRNGALSKIPVKRAEGKNYNSGDILGPATKGTKRLLERSITASTPDRKQIRADVVKSRHDRTQLRGSQEPMTTSSVSYRRNLEPPPTTPTKSASKATVKKTTSTPLNGSAVQISTSRLVLTPLDISNVNKSIRPTTRSVTEFSKRSLRRRNN